MRRSLAPLALVTVAMLAVGCGDDSKSNDITATSNVSRSRPVL